MTAEKPGNQPGAVIPGQSIEIRCVLRHGRTAEVAVTSRAVPPIGRLVVGKPPEAVLPLFGSLFGLCRHAQCHAAVTALEQALNVTVPMDLGICRDNARELEIVREHCLNVLMRQPAGGRDPVLGRDLIATFTGLSEALGGDRLYRPSWNRPRSPHAAEEPEVDAASFSAGLERLDTLLARLLGGLWELPEPALATVSAWAADDPSPAAALVANCLAPGWAEFGSCPFPALPELEADRLASVLDAPAADEFLRFPTWNGSPRETNAFTRQARTPVVMEAVRTSGNGLLSRTLARLMEIGALYRRVRDRGIPLATTAFPPAPAETSDGIGFAQIEASRGRLIHRVELRACRVAAYRILAPTEWNFHPEGLVRQALTGLSAADPARLRAQIAAWLHAIDPCVDFRVTVVEA